jgi:hypothetical protein
VRSKLLIPTAAAVLLAGTVLAGAQGQQRGAEPGGAAGAAQEKSMPSGKGAQGSGATQGQGQREESKEKATPNQRSQGEERGKAQGKGQAQGQREPGQREQRQSQQKGDRDRIQTQGQGQREQNSREDRGDRSQQRDRTQGQGQNQREQNAQPSQRNERNEGQTTNRQQTETGRTGGSSVTLTTEQRTKIRESVLRGSNAPRVSKVDFNISVGTVVPRSVHVVTVPQTIVEIHPEWRGYDYFVYNDEIIIIEPGSMKIIAVIDV